MHLSTNLGPEGVGMLRLNRVVPLRYKWKKVRGKKRLCSNHWFTGTVDKLVPRACVTRCAWLRRPVMKQLVADPGEGSAEPGPSPLIFRANWGPKDRKSFVWRPPPPPYLRVWMTAPSLSQGLDPALWKIVHIYIYNFVRASRFFVHFFAVTALLITTWKCLFTFRRGRERRTTTFSFFSWTLIQSFRIEPQKKLPTFDELKEMG